MSMRAKLISGILLAAVALAAWRFMSPPGVAPLVEATPSVPEQTSAPPPPLEILQPAAAPYPVPPLRDEPAPARSSPNPSQRAASPSALNERSLVGTKWEREGFGLEFSANGKLLIGGRERAKWRVEGSRIRLYRDTTGEEHWLDIIGDKLMWEGQEIGRVP